MKKQSINIDYQVLENKDELSEKDLELFEKATEASEKAYAPYSKFHVGAALKLANDKIFIGNNQENASFPAGLCAERNAIFSARANFPNVAIESICIIASGSEHTLINPVTPCGICRQVFAEYEFSQQKPIKFILASQKGKILIFNSIQGLLPFTFYADQLG